MVRALLTQSFRRSHRAAIQFQFRTLLFLVLVASLPADLLADPITLSGAGIVDSVFSPRLAVAGDPFTFSLTFDAGRTAPVDTRVILRDVSLMVTLGTARNSPFNSPFRIFDGDVVSRPPGEGDFVEFFFRLGSHGAGLDLRADAGNTLNANAWPTGIAAALNAFAHNQFNVNLGGDEISPFDFAGTVTHFEQTAPFAPTPEPASIILLGTGVVGVVARGWPWSRKTRLR